ncbi:MAG: hypothetical protein HY900_19480, partial [Deltaproteobacteria bacterium]|nr:hypothetical protein [Deltaproteobacteria bacterium]
RLFFMLAVFAAGFLFVARVLVVAAAWIAPTGRIGLLDRLRDIVHTFVPFQFSGTVVLTCFLVPLGVLTANRHYGRNPSGDDVPNRTLNAFLRVAARLPSKSLSELLFEAQQSGEALLFTMKNRKVYVGHILSFSLAHDAKDFSILPAHSGYRDTETLNVHLENSYQPTLDFMDSLNRDEDEALAKAERALALELVLKTDEVATVSRFEASLLQEHATKRDTAKRPDESSSSLRKPSPRWPYRRPSSTSLRHRRRPRA